MWMDEYPGTLCNESTAGHHAKMVRSFNWSVKSKPKGTTQMRKERVKKDERRVYMCVCVYGEGKYNGWNRITVTLAEENISSPLLCKVIWRTPVHETPLSYQHLDEATYPTR